MVLDAWSAAATDTVHGPGTDRRAARRDRPHRPGAAAYLARGRGSARHLRGRPRRGRRRPAPPAHGAGPAWRPARAGGRRERVAARAGPRAQAAGGGVGRRVDGRPVDDPAPARRRMVVRAPGSGRARSPRGRSGPDGLGLSAVGRRPAARSGPGRDAGAAWCRADGYAGSPWPGAGGYAGTPWLGAGGNAGTARPGAGRHAGTAWLGAGRHAGTAQPGAGRHADTGWLGAWPGAPGPGAGSGAPAARAAGGRPAGRRSSGGPQAGGGFRRDRVGRRVERPAPAAVAARRAAGAHTVAQPEALTGMPRPGGPNPVGTPL